MDIFKRYSKRLCRHLIVEAAELNLREEMNSEADPPPVDMSFQDIDVVEEPQGVFEEHQGVFEEGVIEMEDETLLMPEDRVFLEDFDGEYDEEDEDYENVENPTHSMVEDDDKLQILKMKLRRFIVRHIIPFSQVSELLSILREFGINLPKTRSGLLQTKRTLLITSYAPPGKCIYIGIQNNVFYKSGAAIFYTYTFKNEFDYWRYWNDSKNSMWWWSSKCRILICSNILFENEHKNTLKGHLFYFSIPAMLLTVFYFSRLKKI